VIAARLGALARHLRADLLGWTAAELGARTGESSTRILDREQGLHGGPTEDALRVLCGERAVRGVRGAIDAWSVEELRDVAARWAAERAPGRAAERAPGRAA
jgi:hypothetical protein